MKKSIYLILALICSLDSFAQTPGTFNYQAVVRDASGVIFSNQPVIIDLAIVKDSVDGLIMYEETWDTVTSTLGLVNLEIGSKDIQSFKNLNWMYGPYFISVSVNGEFLGTSQLLSVPFAQLAQRVVEGGANDADADPTNEIQDISLAGDQLSISGGSTVTLPDSDPTNEIQDISLTGDQLSISGGSTVTLPGVDESPTLTISGHRLSISNGNTVILPDRYKDNDASPTNEIELPTQTSGDANKSLVADGAGSVSWQTLSSASETDPVYSAWDKDYADLTNTPAAWDSTYTSIKNTPDLSGYTTQTALDDSIASVRSEDSDTDATNEIQILSISNDTIYLSDGNFAELPDETDPDYNAWDKDYADLINTPAAWDSTYASIKNTPATWDSTYASIKNTPDLSGYATQTALDDSIASVRSEDGDIDATNEIELPTQTGNSGKLLTTDGTAPSWTTVSTFSGSYNDLTDLPANLDIDATDDFDGTYSSLDTTGLQITESQISDLTHFTNSDETDPVYSAWDKTTGISITESQISDLGTYIETETDPAVSSNFDFTDAANGDILQFDGTKWVKVTPTYISDYTVTESDVTAHEAALTVTESQISDLGTYIETEIDPSVPAGTQAGEMQYWNGSEWITVATGNEGQVLTFNNGVPTWEKPAIPTVGASDVYNHATGKVWMDRNLGASQVATSSDDSDAYGDLYQWGRAADGHELRTSSTTSTNATTAVPDAGHAWNGLFITEGFDPFDWLTPQDNSLWQGVSGTNNPCPSGYRLPTETEWEAERQSWGNNNAAGAFASPLKLPVAGGRSYNNGSLIGVGSFVGYWSSSVSGTRARFLNFDSSDAYIVNNYRAYGYSVRCIKD